ncbi:phage holin family protein [Paenibacillus chitinolyticus]|uniref:phage holin family protein n=1 Tax=Paenibacillus chitinolyticus TaxID=79263 RepID=UPI001C482E14|nr:phage holin family protein [Paenibacillus chitinolyticus]MBV6714038.1 phage holin family protein [Paenibacillus chitinolyticus]
MNQTIFGSLAAFGASLVTYAFGGWSELLGFFLVAIAIDYVTGVAASLKEKSGLNSNIGFWGLAKKGLMLLIILLGHRMDMLIGSSVVMDAAIYFYLVNELISITENYGRLGLPLPDKFKEIIAQLKNPKQDKN